MKKPVVIALGAAIVVLSYPATAWWLGRNFETSLDEQYRSLGEQPYVKVVKREYQRGIFSSTETVTMELAWGNKLPSPTVDGSLVSEEATPAVSPKPFQLTLRSEIKHGPLPGLSTLAAVVADSELVFDGEQQQRVSEFFGGQKPLKVHTEFGFLGGGVTTASSPAFTFDSPVNAEGKSRHAAWGGIQMSVNFSSGMQHYTMKLAAPSLEIKDEKGAQALLSGLNLEAEQQRLFDDEPGFYSGSTRMTVDQVSFVDGEDAEENFVSKREVLLKQLSYDALVPVSGEFIDVIGKIGAETAQLGAQNYGPAHYDFSFRHLHARTAASFKRELMKWYADSARLAAKEGGNPAQMLAPLRESALALLKYAPEVRVDRISFKTSQGEAQIVASAKLGELQPEELDNPLMLLGKLEASADITLPEDMVGDKFQPEQIAGFVEQGFMQREGSILHTKIAFAQGQLTVNGKPFQPMAMGGGQ